MARVTSTREAEQVTFGSNLVEAMDVSPDGRKLVYDSEVGGNQDIYLKTIGEPSSIQLTAHDANDFLSTWVDDTKVLFYSLRRGGRDVYLLDTQTREVELLVDIEMQLQHPHMSRDGRKLLFRAFESRVSGRLGISERALDGSWGTPRFLDLENIGVARWSPTDDRICYNAADGLSVVDPESGSRTQLVSREQLAVQHPRWAPDGSTIYFQASDGEGNWGLWTIAAAGGNPRQVVKYDEPDKRYGYHYISTDGEYLYFTLKQAESDIWVLDLDS
jgi:Tol biopolymer transport system component